MFQTSSEFLAVMGKFAAAGVLLAVFCDGVRFIRIVLNGRKAAVFVTDFFLTVVSMLVIMIMSVEYGAGILRGYYIISTLFGMVLYFFTIGFITKAVAVFIGKLVFHLKRYLYNIIYNPFVTFFSSIQQKMLNVFEQLRQKTSKCIENLHFGLKKQAPMMYNNKIGKLCANGGEERNVIKAKVRKKA